MTSFLCRIQRNIERQTDIRPEEDLPIETEQQRQDHDVRNEPQYLVAAQPHQPDDCPLPDLLNDFQRDNEQNTDREHQEEDMEVDTDIQSGDEAFEVLIYYTDEKNGLKYEEVAVITIDVCDIFDPLSGLFERLRTGPLHLPHPLLEGRHGMDPMILPYKGFF